MTLAGQSARSRALSLESIRWRRLMTICVSAVLLGLFLIITSATPLDAVVTAALVAPFLVAYLTRNYLNSIFVSPVLLTALIFAVVGDVGYLFRDVFAGETGASIKIYLDDISAARTIVLVNASSVILIAFGAISRTFISTVSGGDRDRFEIGEGWIAPKPPVLLLILLAFGPVYYLVTAGPGLFFYRDTYLFGVQGSFESAILPQLLTLSVITMGYMFARSSAFVRTFAFVLGAANVLVLLSLGSRRLALVPALFALGVFLGRNNRVTRWGVLAGVMGTFVLLPLPLAFRSGVVHGIIPYVDVILNYDWVNVDYIGSLNNVFVGFGIIGQSAFGSAQVSWQDILVSLNPATGESAGFYEISQRLRLNAYTPMAGIGELGNVGPLAVFTVIGLFGIVLGFFENVVARQLHRRAYVYVGIIQGAVALFALQMTQYNLRLSSRLITYLLLAEVGRRIVVALGGAGRYRIARVGRARQIGQSTGRER